MRKGQFRAIFVFGFLAVFSIVAAPRLPELMALTGMATGPDTPIQELEAGTPDINNTRLTNDGLVFDLSVPVENPNQFSATVNRVNYTAYINGSEIFEGSVSEEASVPPESQKEVNTSVTVEVDSVVEGLTLLSQVQTSSNLRIEGELYTDIGPATLVTSFENED